MKKITYLILCLTLTTAIEASDSKHAQIQQELTAVVASITAQQVQAPEVETLIRSNAQLVLTNAQLVKELNNRRDYADQFTSCCNFLAIGLPRKCCNMVSCSMFCSDHMCPLNNNDQF